MERGLGIHADGSGSKEVLCVSKRSLPHKPGRRKSLEDKKMATVCKFLLKDIIYRFSSVGKIMTNKES